VARTRINRYELGIDKANYLIAQRGLPLGRVLGVLPAAAVGLDAAAHWSNVINLACVSAWVVLAARRTSSGP